MSAPNLQDMTKEEIIEHFNPVYMMVEAMMPANAKSARDPDLYFTAMLRQLVTVFMERNDLTPEELIVLVEREGERMRKGWGKHK